MVRLGAFLAGAATGAVLAVVSVALALTVYFESPGPAPREGERLVYIPPGSGVIAIAYRLEDAGVIHSQDLFRIGVMASGRQGALQAGEYAFKQAMAPSAVLDRLVEGDRHLRQITIPEGLTRYQVLERLRGADSLTGSITDVPEEGYLLPETYAYNYNDTRQSLVRRMEAQMAAVIEDEIQPRLDGIALDTAHEVLTLASIVERETGVAEEKPIVAGVFYNRLDRGMRLQADATVVYALSDGRGTIDRRLTRQDWRIDSPYNTYRIDGLPPAPIANPGIESIRAVLAPAETTALYFVADGTGGHVFADTLEAHNRNVEQWRQIRDDRSGDSE